MADIIDNAPEMEQGEQFDAMLAAAKSGKAETDVKEPEPASSADAKEPDPDDKPQSKEDYEARIKGLQAELGRRKGNAERVEQLEQELAYLKGQLDTLTKTKATESVQEKLTAALQKLTDEDLISKQTDWEEELSSLRAKYDRAEELGNSDTMEHLAQKIAYAKQLIKAMRVEGSTRSERRHSEQEAIANAGQVLESELGTMFEVVTENHPDFKDPESELWKAGEEEYNAYPLLMERLGPAAQVVAAAMAIVKRPELVGAKTSTSVRKDVIANIDKGLTKALHKGGANAPSTGRATNYNIDSSEGLAAFEAMVTRIKGGI